jgi:hypothetical protein
MRVRLGLVGGALGVGALGFVAAVVLVSAASAHSNPCHSQHNDLQGGMDGQSQATGELHERA